MNPRNLLAGYRACAQREVSTRYVDVLDGVRALAIFIVAWFHIWQQSWLRAYIHIESTGRTILNVEPLVRTGYIMVDVMLLISGFLLFLPYARRMVEGGPKPSVKEFYVKRALRILPTYYFSVFVVLIGFALPGRGFRMDAVLWKDLWTHLTFTHVFFYETYVATELNVVLWTLAIEVQFYLIFPLVAWAFSKRPLITWAALTAAGLAFRQFVVLQQADSTLYINQLPAFLDVYANGMLAAICYVHLARAIKHDKWTRLAGTALSVIVTLAIWQLVLIHSRSGTFEMIRRNQANYRFLLSVYVCVLMLAAAHAGAGLRYLLSNKAMRFFAAISFHYYIWHQFIAAKMRGEWRFPPSVSPTPHEVGERPWQWLFTLCAFVFPLILSAMLTYWFERPITQMGLQAWNRRKRRLMQKQQSKSDANGGVPA
ncbi:MAG: acyltransferase [Clostridia bacterium]|nr:acyltransferase [Clostridia bacterium]